MQVGDFHLGYCTNIHPGESLEEIEQVLLGHVAAVKKRVSPDGAFGLGLRLGNAAATTLNASPSRLEELAERLRAHDLYVFTVNGFPYGDFAAASVKARVYEPSWLDEARLSYTQQLGRALTRLPGPQNRTISTVAGCFRKRAHDKRAFETMAKHLGMAAATLADLADSTGVSVRLCLEPEPWTTLEQTSEVIEFFERYLAPLGSPARDHLGLCYDCCHQAVMFEDPAKSLAQLAAAGIAIGKIQVSSALHLGSPQSPEARAALQRFAEPRYLHQVVGLGPDDELMRAVDLPEVAHPTAAWARARAWRCHFHVPIWWSGSDRLGTTRSAWEQAVRSAVDAGLTQHLEIETYSWNVIPDDERVALEGGDLHACVASEIDAVGACVVGRVSSNEKGTIWRG